jgi:DNA-binding GntR family transcriptional regulator
LLNRFGLLVADFLELSFQVQQAAADGGGVDLTDDVEGHAAVLDAINRGDSEAAASAILAVVLDGKSALIEAFAAEGGKGK